MSVESIYIDGVEFTVTRLYQGLCRDIREKAHYSNVKVSSDFLPGRSISLKKYFDGSRQNPKSFPDWVSNSQIEEYLVSNDADIFMIGYELIKDKL